MLSANALTFLRSYFMGKISYAAYLVDETEYTTDIQTAVLQEDGRIEITVSLDHDAAEEITMTEVRLYDQDDVLLASKAENIVQNAGQEGILYRFTFTIEEES